MIDPKDAEYAKSQHVKSCNFNFDFKGAPDSMRVTKIDGFSVKAKTIDYHHAGRLDPLQIPGKLEFPNITFYVPEPDAGIFIDIARNLAAGRRPAPTQASIEFYDSAKQVKGVIEFEGCRVFSAAHDKLDAANEDVRSVKVEMAVESVLLRAQ